MEILYLYGKIGKERSDSSGDFGRGREVATWVILHKAFAEVSQLISGDIMTKVIGRLEVQIICPMLPHPW